MSGLASVTPVQAAASAGDLIKMEGLSSVYYLGDDGKRYVFPNESTYFSWYADFSGVVTIPASELQSYPLGGNVTMRPGTTLVKITTDPSVYAVEPNGVLRKVANEAQAAALYGTNWNKRIVDLADSFFTNYTIGAPLADGQIPVGSLVKNADSAAVYYWDGTNYRAVASEAAMAANRLWMKYVMTVTNTLTSGGNAIVGMETALVKTSQGATTGPIVTGSGLMISLNAMTPAAMSVPKNGTRVPMTKVNLTAANDGAVSVNSIVVKRIGLSTNASIDRVWAERDGVVIASKKSVNSADEATLVFSPALIVNAGQTASFDIIASLTNASGNIGFGIISASAVSATAASVTGSFPINGNLMSPTEYNVATLSFATSTVSSNVKVGDNDVELANFRVGFSSDARDVYISSITFKNNGAEDLSKVTSNLYLEYAGNKVSTQTIVDGRFVTFNFPANYALLRDDAEKTFHLKGNIIAKEITASTDSLSFVLNKKTDLVAYEKATGFGANVNVVDGFAVSDITIDSGALSLTKKSTSPASDSVVKGADFVALLANLRADEAINVDGLKLHYASNVDNATTTNQFDNVRVYVNNVLLDSFDPSYSTTTTLTANVDSAFTLNKGDNEIKITARAKTDAASNAAIKFTLSNDIFTGMNAEYINSGNRVASAELTNIGQAEGGTFTVANASMIVTRNDGYSDNRTIVQGSTDVSLGKFVVKAENDQVRITSIGFGGNASTTLASSIYNMKLFIDGVQFGGTLNFGTSGVTFSSVNKNVAKDSTIAIELKGSFDTSATGGFESLMTVNAQDSRGTTITSNRTASTTTFALTSSGDLNVELAGDTPVAGLLASKPGVEQEVAQFKLTAVNDSANVTEMNMTGFLEANDRIASVRLYDGSNMISSFVPVLGNGKFTISNQTIAANTSKTYSVRVVLNNIENDANATNKAFAAEIDSVKFKASSGTEYTETDNVAANQFIIRKTVPTIAYQPLASTVLAAGDKMIAKFTVTADGNADVTVGEFTLNVATSSGATLATTTNTLVVNGANKNATTTVTFSGANGTMRVQLHTNEIVAAGTTKTFEVWALLGVAGSGSESVTARLVEDGTFVTNGTGNFVWSDGSSIIAPTWANGYRVKGLSTNTWTLSK